jgi:hypothetical protein
MKALSHSLIEVLSRDLPGRSEENLSHYSQCPSPDLNPLHHKYRSRESLPTKESIDSIGASQEEVSKAAMNSVWHMCGVDTRCSGICQFSKN